RGSGGVRSRPARDVERRARRARGPDRRDRGPSGRDARAGPSDPEARRVTEAVVDRYLRLGLQLGRHVEGIVDAYFGPSEPAAAIAAAPPVEPRTLVADGEALLGDLEDGWLRDQVGGLRTYAGVLAGDAGSYADEVEGCYGVRPEYTSEAVFLDTHAELDELLPGA